MNHAALVKMQWSIDIDAVYFGLPQNDSYFRHLGLTVVMWRVVLLLRGREEVVANSKVAVGDP